MSCSLYWNIFTEFRLNHYNGAKPPRLRQSKVNLQSRKSPGSDEALYFPGSLPWRPSGTCSTGPTPYHACWIGGLLSQKIPAVQPKYTEENAQEKWEYNTQAGGLSFLKRKGKDKNNKMQGNFSKLLVIASRTRYSEANACQFKLLLNIFYGKLDSLFPKFTMYGIKSCQLDSSVFRIIHFIFSIFIWGTPCPKVHRVYYWLYPQNSLLVRTSGALWGSGDQIQIDHMQGKDPIHCTLTLAPNIHFPPNYYFTF